MKQQDVANEQANQAEPAGNREQHDRGDAQRRVADRTAQGLLDPVFEKINFRAD